METTKTKNTEIAELLAFDKKISEKEIEDFLKDTQSNTSMSTIRKVGEELLTFSREHSYYFGQRCDVFDRIRAPKGTVLSQARQANSAFASSKKIQPKEDEVITYIAEFDKLLYTEYERKLGSDGMTFINQEVIDKQRSVAGYLIKKIGLNLIKGKSIMNVSLPINIFDTRSILELFVWQNAYAAILLEEGAKQKTALEKIKYSTCFAITKFHLSGAQLKPFNPILGETFQSKVLDSHFYLEQTCHHPPILNFYGCGKNYKIYGHNESEASTGANSVKVYYKGNFFVQYSDGTRHKIVYPTLKLDGTMVGARQLKFRGKLLVIDEKNDLLVHVELDPDDRGFFKKLSTKKETFPDYMKGVVTSISKNAKYDKKEETYNLIDNKKHVLSELEGEFTQEIKFDNVIYWKYAQDAFPNFRRMKYTLPSDSTFRDDIAWLKNKDEDMSQRFKVYLEEIQRNDKKLREMNEAEGKEQPAPKEEKKKKK